MQDIDLDKVIKLAEEKQSLLEKLLKLSETQADAISQKNYEFMFNIINEKQNLIERINLLNLEIKMYIPENDDHINKLNSNMKDIVLKAIALDNKNIELLKQNQAEVFAKLKNAKKNIATHSLYRGKNLGVEGILVDQKK